MKVLVLILMILAALVIVISCIILSSQISREEEYKGLEEYLHKSVNENNSHNSR